MTKSTTIITTTGTTVNSSSCCTNDYTTTTTSIPSLSSSIPYLPNPQNFIHTTAGIGCHIALPPPPLSSLDVSLSSSQEQLLLSHHINNNKYNNNNNDHYDDDDENKNDDYYNWVLGWETIQQYNDNKNKNVDGDDDVDDDDDENDEWESIDDDDEGNDNDSTTTSSLPELSIDPNQYYKLSCLNYHTTEYQIAYISIYDIPIYSTNTTRTSNDDVPIVRPLTSSHTTTTTTTTTRTATGTKEETHHHHHHRTCTTLIVLSPPQTVCHLGYLNRPFDNDNTKDNNNNNHIDSKIMIDQEYIQTNHIIDSDIQIYQPHLYIDDIETTYTIRFPFLTTTTTNSSSNTTDILLCNTTIENDTTTITKENIQSQQQSSYLCTQGIGGSLTHFLLGNYHAIDFACPINTPIVAVGNGIIVQVHIDDSSSSSSNDDTFNNNNNTDTEKNSSMPLASNIKKTITKSGIAVNNLFHWNSIMLQLDNNVNNTNDTSSSSSSTIYIEYVHIATSYVHVGQYVNEGQIIGTSGNIGFTPEPHLHIAAYRSMNDTAPTCGIYFHTTKPLPTKCYDNMDSNNTTYSSSISNSTNYDDHHNCNVQQQQEEAFVSTKFLPVAGQWYNEQGLVKST